MLTISDPRRGRRVGLEFAEQQSLRLTISKFEQRPSLMLSVPFVQQ